jgi:TDG/mug DNA glycosylase family protein
MMPQQPISTEDFVRGFLPLVNGRPRVLILGSAPSVASLEKQQYYGKPQNAFWGLMGELFGAGPEIDYEQRVALLTDAGVAVWDVLASCERTGSLDSAIDMSSAAVNEFVPFLKEHAGIRHVFFNGRKAEEVFKRRVLAQMNALRPDIHYTCLPSTSPAMAVLNFEAKLERWSIVRTVLEQHD